MLDFNSNCSLKWLRKSNFPGKNLVDNENSARWRYSDRKSQWSSHKTRLSISWNASHRNKIRSKAIKKCASKSIMLESHLPWLCTVWVWISRFFVALNAHMIAGGVCVALNCAQSRCIAYKLSNARCTRIRYLYQVQSPARTNVRTNVNASNRLTY